MIEVSFTEYRYFSECPIWWRNFCTVTSGEWVSADGRNLLLIAEIAKFSGNIVDGGNNEDVDHLEFETEEDFNLFKTYWILRGK